MATMSSSRRTPLVRDKLVIDGEFVEGHGDAIPVYNPATEELIAEVPAASLAQVDQAVAAARRAADEGPWPTMSPKERSAAMHRFADAFEAHRDDLIATIVSEVGTPISISEPLQVGSALTHLRHYADLAGRDLDRDLGPDASPPSASVVAYRPAGVAVGVTAYNYPLMIAASKFGAALAAGCPTVLLPSPRTPLTSLFLGELAMEAELPPGVLNVIHGGPDVGVAVTQRADVDRVSFTGSVGVGQAIMRQCVDHVTGVVLELGGKSADIILPDYELTVENVIGIHGRYLRNAGQGCASPTRMLIHESKYDEFLEVTQQAYAAIPFGDPWDPETWVGPVIRPEHRDSILGFVERAVTEGGGKVVAGGGDPGFDRGWWVSPTLIGDISPEAEIAQEELFGPVGVVLPYRDLDHAVQIANGTKFGLAGYVHGDLDQAKSIAARMRAGSVYINGGGGIRPDAPFGGWGASSIGREWGAEGVREYLEPQHIQWRTA